MLSRSILGRAALVLAFLLTARDAFAGGPRRTGTVTLNCAVPGATVSVDGEEVGSTPIDPFELRLGNHTIRVVRAGLIAFEQQVSVHPGEQLKVVAIAREARSLLTINTTEKGGEVLLDGRSLGALPLKEATIAPGEHSMFIRKDGLQPYKESFNVDAFHEYVSTPKLRRKDGSLVASASAGLGLGLNLDIDAPAAKPSKAAPPPSDSLDLDLDLAPAPAPAKVAKNDPKAAAKPPSDELDLDLDLPPVPATSAPAKVAANTPPPAKMGPPAPGATKAAPVATPKATARPKQVELAAKVAPPPASTTFVADPVAKAEAEDDEEEDYDPTPIYQRKWVWATAAVVAVAAVAVPVAMGKTGGYVEQRNPDAVCRSCIAVMNR